MRGEPHGVSQALRVVRQLGEGEATDTDIALVLALVVVFECELDPVARPEVESSPPEPVTLTCRDQCVEGALRLQRVDNPYRAIFVDRTGEQVRSLPAVKRPAKAHVPVPLREIGLLLHERTPRADRRIAEHE